MPQGLETDLGQGGVNVSGGQEQRLCIARAILKKPKVLILDDSTSAVDTATDAKIRGPSGRISPAPPRSLSLSGSVPSATPTRSSCWMTVMWRPMAPTRSCWKAAIFTARSINLNRKELV